MGKPRVAPICSMFLIPVILLQCAVLARQSESTWQDGTVSRVESALFEGGHVDKPGHVSIFRATGCTYVKKCGWLVTLEVQEWAESNCGKKIWCTDRMVSMHYEDVNLQRVTTFGYVRVIEEGILFCWIETASRMTFPLSKLCSCPYHPSPSRQEPSANSAALGKRGTETSTRPTIQKHVGYSGVGLGGAWFYLVWKSRHLLRTIGWIGWPSQKGCHHRSEWEKASFYSRFEQRSRADRTRKQGEHCLPCEN